VLRAFGSYFECITITNTDYSLLNARSALRQGVNHITAVHHASERSADLHGQSCCLIFALMNGASASLRVWPHSSAQGLPFFIIIVIIIPPYHCPCHCRPHILTSVASSLQSAVTNSDFPYIGSSFVYIRTKSVASAQGLHVCRRQGCNGQLNKP
jgi:hypothetical protein